MVRNMKILKSVIAKANDTLDEIWWYAKEATLLKDERRALADVYIRIAEAHVQIYNMLHERMVALINEERSKGTQPPVSMMAIWEYEHGKLVDEFISARYMIDEYKKS